ncbi:hypothetical protein ACFX2J_038537 [Malus domestica]
MTFILSLSPSSAMAGSATGSGCALCLWSVAMLSGHAQWQCNGCVMVVLGRQCNGCAQWLCSVKVVVKLLPLHLRHGCRL